ncbi:hypothetical protein ACP6PL_15060 [Dapis sp. BLCC M126]|uniref:hypothetical protein n=1 Tax=Dapis sp. BLCC M126 TaxID=3400189 RepID=UPI003CF6C9D6
MNYIANFEIPYEITDKDGVGVHLLTGLRTSEIALAPNFKIVEEERSPANLQASHEINKSQTDFTKTQEMNLEAEGSKDSMKIGWGLDTLIQNCLTSKSVIATSIASIVAGKDSYDRSTVSLSKVARNTLETNPEDFNKRFGTHFIGGYKVGANFYSVLKFETKSITDQRAVATNLNASYLRKIEGQGGTGKYGLDETTTKMISKVQGRLFATGITVNANVSDVDEVAREFAEFSKNAMKTPTRITAICYPYSMLEDVQDIMQKHGNPGQLIPEVEYSLINAICQETRSAMRALSMISLLNYIAEGVPALQKISDKYRHLLQEEMDDFRSLSLSELHQPSENLLTAIGWSKESGTILYEGHSKSTELYRNWESDFGNAYNDII